MTDSTLLLDLRSAIDRHDPHGTIRRDLAPAKDLVGLLRRAEAALRAQGHAIAALSADVRTLAQQGPQPSGDLGSALD